MSEFVDSFLEKKVIFSFIFVVKAIISGHLCLPQLHLVQIYCAANPIKSLFIFILLTVMGCMFTPSQPPDAQAIMLPSGPGPGEGGDRRHLTRGAPSGSLVSSCPEAEGWPPIHHYRSPLTNE